MATHKILIAALAGFTLSFSPALSADDDDDNDDRIWRDHAHPYTFLFGNHIDTHEELKYRRRAAGDLKGWFYVFDSGESTHDGLPILKHCTKPEHYAAGCVAGWKLEAKPCIPELDGCQAMYLYHYHDHPVWLVCPVRDDTGNLRAERNCVPQPGSYTHYHWVTEGAGDFPSDLNPNYPMVQPGDLPHGVIDSPLEEALGIAIDVPDACNVAMASQHTPGSVCPGFFLQLKAGEPFGYETWAFRHGGQDIIVTEGWDNRTHLNLLLSFAPEPIPQEVVDALPASGGGHGDDSGGSGGGSHTGGGGH